MTSTQTTLFTESFWDSSVHSRERDNYGQEFLNKSRKRLGGQNKRVFEYLMTGAEADDDTARSWKPEIRHLHSRVPDLTGMGFLISRKPHPTKNLTIYFCTPEQIIFNNQLINNSSK